MRYFEILFSDEYGICIRANRKPDYEEASDFLSEDMIELGYLPCDIEDICELSREEAYAFYDMEDESKYPIFGE